MKDAIICAAVLSEFVQEHHCDVSPVKQQAGSKTRGSTDETGRNLLVMPGVKAGKGSAEDREDSADVSKLEIDQK